MASVVKTASPAIINLGTDDQSKGNIYATTEPLPQHLPKFYIMGQKSRGDKGTLVNAAKLPLLVGSGSLDPNGKYFNHATRLLKLILSTGNLCMVQRLIPEDAGPKANATIYLDIATAKLPNYLRDSFGNLVPDAKTGNYKVDATTPTIDGFTVKYIKEVDTDEPVKLGTRIPKAGTLVNVDGSASVMYPILELRAAYQGEYYNNIGFKLSSVTGSDVDTKVVSKLKSLPFSLALVTRDNAKSSPSTFRNLYGEPFTNFVFKDKAISPTTEARIDLEYVFNSYWFNETDDTKPLKYNEYEGLHFYRQYFEKVQKDILDKERMYVSTVSKTWADGDDASTSSWFDFTTDDAIEIDAEYGLINPFTCKSTDGVRFFTVAKDTTTVALAANQMEVAFDTDTPIWLGGGSDGTIDNDMFETLFIKEMAKYADPNSEVQDTAINVETWLYDTGFRLPAKKEMTNFILLRKNTHVIIGTHDAELKESFYQLSDTRAIGNTINNRLALAPESDYFGTGVCRAIICAGAGKLRDGSTNDYVSTSFEIGYKTAMMMGASNGMWKSSEMFDRAPGNILTLLTDVQPAFIPADIKPTMWTAGLVWAQPYDLKQYQFPAIQTVYTADTSVLNNYFATAALCYLSTVGDKAHREFTGSTGLTNGQFIDAVQNFIAKEVANKHAGMFKVVPVVTITEGDKALGYSWHVTIKLYGNNSKTVMVYNSAVYRMSDLDTTSK